MIKDRLSIIIPTKNEARSIGDIITKCRKYSDDIVIIDGHSSDGTREIALGMGAQVYLDAKKGKGSAIRLGALKASKDVLIFIDADGSHDPDDIPRLTEPILSGEADHVSSSRMTGGSDELHGDMLKFIRMLGSDIITLAINYRFNVRLTDTQNGFRAIKKTVALSLGLKEDMTAIEQEMIIKTLKKGYRLAEVPAHEYARRYGSSRIRLRKVWFRHVYSLIKYLFLV